MDSLAGSVLHVKLGWSYNNWYTYTILYFQQSGLKVNLLPKIDMLHTYIYTLYTLKNSTEQLQRWLSGMAFALHAGGRG